MDDIKSKILIELEKHKGIVTSACASMSLARSTFYNWVQTDPEFKAAVEEVQEVAIDFVESKLMEKINGVTMSGKAGSDDEDPTYTLPPSDTAIIFYLKTKGKKRGYVERSEVDQTINGELTHHIKEHKRTVEDYSTTKFKPETPGDGI